LSVLGVVAISAFVAAAIAVLPRLWLRRAQDRLAQRLLSSEGPDGFRLLTRADLVSGKHRRLPGILGLSQGALTFHGIFDERITLPTDRIQKIVTGNRLAGGPRLIRSETLRLTRADGEELAFVLTRSAARAWRSHLGLWAVRERQESMDVVKPGRRT